MGTRHQSVTAAGSLVSDESCRSRARGIARGVQARAECTKAHKRQTVQAPERGLETKRSGAQTPTNKGEKSWHRPRE